MQFIYSTLKQHSNNLGRYALLVLIISLVALSGLLVSGSASSQDKFTIKAATTTEDNGKLLRPKPGFKLKIKDQKRGEVVAFKAEKPTVVSSDTMYCTCVNTSGPGGGTCKVSTTSNGGSLCSGNCQQCLWRQ